MIGARIYMAVALVAALLALGWYAQHQTERAVAAEQRAQLAAEQNDAWRMALDQQTRHARETDHLLAQSRHAQQALRTVTDMRIRDYESALRDESGAGDWDAGVVPAAVARRMCEYRADQPTGGDTMPTTAGAAAAADTDPACRPSNGQLWRWAEHLIEALGSCNEDKSALNRWAVSGDAVSPAPPR